MDATDTTYIRMYAVAMKEIKLRKEVIDPFLSGQREAKYMPTSVETVGLQFHKIFELIVFALLAANRERYSIAYADFASHWQISRLLKNLEQINPNFYPIPVTQQPAGQPYTLGSFEKRIQDDYLTQGELIEAYGQCTALMHAANPFGTPIDYESYKPRFSIWMTKIVNLLDCHQVHLVGDTGFWLVQMQEEGKGNEVTWYRFCPL